MVFTILIAALAVATFVVATQGKTALINWLVTNMLEMSTWVGLIIFFREAGAYSPSTIMIVLALVLIFVSDAKLNAFIQQKTPRLKAWLESL